MENNTLKRNLFRNIGFTLPLLAIGPILFTIGLKAYQKDGIYAFLIVGTILLLLGIVMLFKSINSLLKLIFNEE